MSNTKIDDKLLLVIQVGMSFLTASGPQDQEMGNGIDYTIHELNPRMSESMEVEPKPPDPADNDPPAIFSLAKATHHLVKLEFLEGNEMKLNERQLFIKKMITEEMRINIVNANMNMSKKVLLIST